MTHTAAMVSVAWSHKFVVRLISGILFHLQNEYSTDNWKYDNYWMITFLFGSLEDSASPVFLVFFPSIVFHFCLFSQDGDFGAIRRRHRRLPVLGCPNHFGHPKTQLATAVWRTIHLRRIFTHHKHFIEFGSLLFHSDTAKLGAFGRAVNNWFHDIRRNKRTGGDKIVIYFVF